MIKWKKLGCIIHPMGKFEWDRSYVMVPVALPLSDDIIRIYFSGRDKLNRSLIGYAEIDITDPYIIRKLSEEPVLGLGELGCFDDNGVSPSWIVKHEERIYLYYIGWKPRSTTRMSLVAGLAISNDNGKSFTRVSRAPILRLTDEEPFSILTGPCVLKDNDLWRMWYVSGVGWLHSDLPRYNIKYADSNDGLTWDQKNIVCIDFISDDEVALARPCVVKENGVYLMWYSYKKGKTNYRIGYAESANGIDWERMDHKAGIEPSESGWDSDMIEYSYVFSHNSKKYMLYNGNGYGASGVGLAIASE